MKTCVFAGSFDPITCGHLNVITKAKKEYDKVIVVLAVNDAKVPFFSEKERIKFIKKAVKEIGRVKVISHVGFMMDFMKKYGYTDYVRGLRDEKDRAYEKRMEDFNKNLYPELKNVIIYPDEEFKNISSTSVKEKLMSGEDLSGLVPKNIIADVVKTFRRENKKKSNRK